MPALTCCFCWLDSLRLSAFQQILSQGCKKDGDRDKKKVMVF
jgi:hypothetical protein